MGRYRKWRYRTLPKLRMSKILSTIRHHTVTVMMSRGDRPGERLGRVRKRHVDEMWRCDRLAGEHGVLGGRLCRFR